MFNPTPSASRRTMLASSLAGAAALALRHTAAQSATPEATEDIELLFVQTAASGTLTPTGQGYALTFQHGTGQTIYFSDRPERLTGLVPTAEMIAQWPFDDDSPPNAALAISSAKDASATVTVFVGVLSQPAWDAAAGTLSYSFSMLFDDIPAGSPTPAPDAFTNATLFIDGSSALDHYAFINNETSQPIHVVITKNS